NTADSSHCALARRLQPSCLTRLRGSSLAGRRGTRCTRHREAKPPRGSRTEAGASARERIRGRAHLQNTENARLVRNLPPLAVFLKRFTASRTHEQSIRSLQLPERLHSH